MELPEELKKYVKGDVTFKQVDIALCNRFTYFIRDVETNKELITLDGRYFNIEEIKKFDVYEVYDISGYLGICFVLKDNVSSELAYQEVLDFKPRFYDKHKTAVVVYTQNKIHKLPDSFYDTYNRKIMTTNDVKSICLLDDTIYMSALNNEELVLNSDNSRLKIIQMLDCDKDYTIVEVYCLLLNITEGEVN